MKKFTLIIFLIFFSIAGFAQDYIFGDAPSITTCAGTLYDNGGSTGNYTDVQNYTVTIYPQTAGQSVKLDFSLFDIEQYGDNLFIYDGATAVANKLLTTLTGSITTPFSIGATVNNTDAGALTLKFVSNNTVNAAGFVAAISCYTPTASIDYTFQGQANNTIQQASLPCDSQARHFYDSGGKYGIYSSNETRTITFTPATAGQGVLLNFSFIELETGSTSEYISFYDGADTNAPLIGTLSGSYSNLQIGTSMQNTSGKLTVKFKSNFASNFAGWDALVSCYLPTADMVNMHDGNIATCNARFFDNGGQFANYSDGITVGYTYTFNPATAGNKVKVAFNSFNLEASNDRLYVYDGVNTAAPLITVLTGNYSTPPTIVAGAANTSGSLTFVFKSNNTVNAAGWDANVTCVTESVPTTGIYTMHTGTINNACSGTLYDSGGSIGYYNDNENYTLTLCPSDSNETVYLDFTSFNLATSDVLKIYDGNSTSAQLIGTYSGTTLPTGIAGTTLNTSGCLTLLFTSNNAGIAPGWQATLSCGPKIEKIFLNETTNTTSVNSCGALFFDSGGEFGNYQLNEDYTITFYPTIAGQKVRMTFLEFDVEDSYEQFYVYDNTTAAEPFANGLSGFLTGNTLPSELTATNASGALTVRFVSDDFINHAGWKIQLSCVELCKPITAELGVVVPDPVVDADTGELVSTICKGSPITLNAATSGLPNESAALYTWDFGDGTSATGQSVQHVYNVHGGYTITLTVKDTSNTTQDCSESTHLIVHVYPEPDFTGTQPTQLEACLGESIVINGVATPVPVEMDCTPPVSGVTYLPDSSNDDSYYACIDVSCYATSATITSAAQIESICLNMEHSYLGDLDIILHSPGGQSVYLKAFSQGGGGTYLGGANDDGSNTPGYGATYCFTNAATTFLVNGPTITAGSNPPHTSIAPGDYKPFEPFSNLIGSPLNGQWCIEIIDNLAIDNGYIFSWELNFDSSLTQSNFDFTPVFTSQSWTPSSDIISTSGNNITVQPTTVGNHCYTYNVVDDLGCTYEKEVCVTINALPTNPNIAPLHECTTSSNTGTFDLQPVIDGLTGSSPAIFLTEADALANQNPVTQLNNYVSGNATLWVSVENASGCVDAFPFNLVLDALPTNPNIAAVHACTTANNTGTFDLQDVIDGLSGYTASIFSTQADAEANQNPITQLNNYSSGNATLWVRIVNASGCANVFSFNLQLDSFPTTVQVEGLTSCDRGDESGTFNLLAQENLIIGNNSWDITYYQSAQDAQSGTNPINVTNFEEFISISRTLYLRIVDTTTGCFTTSSYTLTVQGCDPEIPNGFSPNGDGINDILIVDNLKGVFPDFKFTVFNRWGNVVYTATNGSIDYVSGNSGSAKLWDGSVDGVMSKDPEATTYFYILEFNNGEKDPKKGWIYVNP